MGHINFGNMINTDIKGLIKFDHVKGHNLMSEKMYKLPLDYDTVKKASNFVFGNYPLLGKATFDL